MKYPPLYKRLIDCFEEYRPLSDEELHAIVKRMDVREYVKGAYLCRDGDPVGDTFFVLAGLVREYKLARSEEISTNFYMEGRWIILPETQGPAGEPGISLQCLEDTSLVVGNEEKGQKLFESFPSLERIARRIMEDHFSAQQQRLRIYQTHTPQERFTALLEEQPELFQRVSQAQIASYIGIRPESLSRIRKRIHDWRRS